MRQRDPYGGCGLILLGAALGAVVAIALIVKTVVDRITH